MPKKLLVLLVSFFVCAMAFAESAPKVLSGKDIDMFVKNFDKIDTDLEALGDKYDDLFAGEETSSPQALFAAVHSTKVPAEIQSVLKKHGLGDNGFEKVMVITMGFTVLEMEDMIQAQLAANPESKSSMDEVINQMHDLKASIHTDDLALINARRDQIRPVITDIQSQNDE